MSEVRVAIKDRWLATPEALVEDERLGLDTRLVAVWLAGKPDSWVIRIGPLCGRLGLGRDRWRRIAGELERHGYLHRERCQRPDGTWGWQFVFSAAGDLAPPSPDRTQQPSAAGRSHHRPLTSKELSQIDDEIEAASRAAARGERKPISHPGRYRQTLANQMRSGTFGPSTAALDLVLARRAEAERQARLITPPPDIPRPATTTPPAAALAKIRAAVGLPTTPPTP